MKYKVMFVNGSRTEVERNIIRGVLAYARDHGPWDISLYPPMPEHIPPLKAMGYHACLGLLGREDLAAFVRASRLPAVNICGGSKNFGLVQVGVSDVEIGAMAADYLVRQGYSNFAFYGLNGEVFSDTRQEGFLSRLKQHNHSAQVYDARITYPQSPRLRSITKNLAEYEPVRWLAQLEPHTAIFASDDLRGSLLGNYAAYLDIRIPEDIGLLSVGNDPIYCETASVPMSSIELPAEEIGYEAAHYLNLLIQKKVPAKSFPHFRPPLRVVERQSTDLLKIEHVHLAKALSYIQQRGRDKVSAHEIARAAGMSLRSLERAFKKQINRTIQQELIRVRLEWAKEALRSTDKSIDTIGGECGFNSGVYLSQLFRKVEKTSPGEYRRNFSHS